MTESRLEGRIARGFSWLAAGALAVAGLYPVNNPDTFGHLAQGRQIAELGHVPPFDTWSLLPGPPRPWYNYEWLSDLLYYGLYAALGYNGLLAFKCVLLVSTALLLLSLARVLAGSRAVVLASLVLISTIPVVRIRLSDRPHVIGLCFAAVYLVALSRMAARTLAPSPRTRAGWLAGLFGLHVLWVNVHGSHLLGFAMAGAFTLLSPREHRRDFFMLLGLFAIASCISPYGPHIVTDAIAHVFDPRYRAIVTEWQPWQADHPPWLQLGPALQGALLTLAAPRLFRVNAGARAAVVVALVLGVASFRSIRFVGEFMLLTAPLLGAGYALVLRSEEDARASTPRFFAGASAALCVLSLVVPWSASVLPPQQGIGLGVSFAGLPHGPGVMLARAKLRPRVFADIGHSWPLMWDAPNARFFVDGRVPFYGPDHVNMVTRAYVDDGFFDAILRRDDMNAVVLNYTFNAERRRVYTMAQRPGWSLVLVDDAFVLYARDDLARASGYVPLVHLRPDYSLGWVLEATPEERARIAEELSQLREAATAQSYRHWLLALLELAPLARAGASAGFRWPESSDDWLRYERASQYLTVASQGAGDLPVVASIRALVQTTLCNFEGAEASLARANSEMELGREGLLVTQELALRKGDVAPVRRFVEAAQALPQAQNDAWLHALSRGLTARPTCPQE